MYLHGFRGMAVLTLGGVTRVDAGLVGAGAALAALGGFVNVPVWIRMILGGGTAILILGVVLMGLRYTRRLVAHSEMVMPPGIWDTPQRNKTSRAD